MDFQQTIQNFYDRLLEYEEASIILSKTPEQARVNACLSGLIDLMKAAEASNDIQTLLYMEQFCMESEINIFHQNVPYRNAAENRLKLYKKLGGLHENILVRDRYEQYVRSLYMNDIPSETPEDEFIRLQKGHLFYLGHCKMGLINDKLKELIEIRQRCARKILSLYRQRQRNILIPVIELQKKQVQRKKIVQTQEPEKKWEKVTHEERMTVFKAREVGSYTGEISEVNRSNATCLLRVSKEEYVEIDLNRLPCVPSVDSKTIQIDFQKNGDVVIRSARSHEQEQYQGMTHEHVLERKDEE